MRTTSAWYFGMVAVGIAVLLAASPARLSAQQTPNVTDAMVREMNQKLSAIIGDELVPGPNCTTPNALSKFIQDEAWGHHASCTNKIGADNDKMAVLDSRFRVRNTQGLRVVDASVFPKIPGYFIVSAVYMISEKASDVITEDAQRK